MNSIATFGLTAIVLFALATGLAVNARAAEHFIYTGNGDLGDHADAKMHVLQTVKAKSEP